MNQNEKIVCSKVLSCLAWADGHLSKEEEETFLQFIKNIAEDSDISKLKQVLSTTKALTQELETEIKGMNKAAFAEVISFAFTIINCDRKAIDSENAILLRIAQVRLGESNAKKLFDWYQHVSQADQIFDEVFFGDEQ